MNIKCFLNGHRQRRLMAFDDGGVAMLQLSNPGVAIRYVPVIWCTRCGKVFGRGFMGVEVGS